MKLQLELSRFCSYCVAAIPFMENGCFNASNYEEFREHLRTSHAWVEEMEP